VQQEGGEGREVQPMPRGNDVPARRGQRAFAIDRLEPGQGSKELLALR